MRVLLTESLHLPVPSHLPALARSQVCAVARRQRSQQLPERASSVWLLQQRLEQLRPLQQRCQHARAAAQAALVLGLPQGEARITAEHQVGR